MGQDLPHSDVNVKSVTIPSSQCAFVSDPNLNLAFESLTFSLFCRDEEQLVRIFFIITLQMRDGYICL